jgi:hypothetical protein
VDAVIGLWVVVVNRFEKQFFLTSEMGSNFRRAPVCSCPMTDSRAQRLDANELSLHFSKINERRRYYYHIR